MKILRASASSDNLKTAIAGNKDFYQNILGKKQSRSWTKYCRKRSKLSKICRFFCETKCYRTIFLFIFFLVSNFLEHMSKFSFEVANGAHAFDSKHIRYFLLSSKSSTNSWWSTHTHSVVIIIQLRFTCGGNEKLYQHVINSF